MLNIVLICLAGFAGWLGYRMYDKRRVRARLAETPLTDAQRRIITQQVPLIRKLPEALRAPLESKIQLFLHQVQFIGCDGLEVSDEMRLSIAVQACLIVVNSEAWYSHLTTILIYPGAFKSRQSRRDGYVVTEAEVVRSGESWTRGPVILSWAHAERGAADAQDGFNVVFHEFAHQLDDLSGHTDGAPLMGPGQSFAEWERVIMDAFERHVGNVEAGRRTVLDAYGAEGVEEFFAVAVELFLERPDALHAAEAEVYAQLSKLLSLDPLGWG